MIRKPVKVRHHGIIDYIFSGIQLGLPAMLGLNKKATRTYAALGSGFLLINALTDTPVAVRRAISFKGHQKADAVFLAGIAALSIAGFIRNAPATRTFHLAFLGTAVAHYLLTDYNSRD